MEVKDKLKDEVSNFNSKKFSVAVAAGYVIRDMALSDTVVPWYYPVIIATIAGVYLAVQTFVDLRKDQK